MTISVTSQPIAGKHESTTAATGTSSNAGTLEETALAAALSPEAAADALLEAGGYLGRGHGIYTGVQLDRKLRRERARLPEPGMRGLPEEIIRELEERRIDELIEASELSAMQEIVFRLYLGGLSWRSMAGALGLDRRLIKRHLRKASGRIRAAYEEGAYAGWYEVYLSEVNRLAHRPCK